MSKVTFKAGEEIKTVVPFEVGNMRLFEGPSRTGGKHGADGTHGTNAEGASPFAGLGYKSDAWKAYVEFEICHALPNVIGPVQEGNYMAYTPETLAASHANLQHQQMNLRHMLKAYDPQNISRDRIIGCVVATWFPKAPLGGWKPAASAAAAPAIRALAVVFKLAEGVNSMLGQHLASRQKQSVSIESITSLGNIGLWRASQPDVVVPLLEPGELEPCLTRSETGNLVVGKFNGEQVVMIYGTGKQVDFRGVGVTPRPAESVAKIVAINAESGAGLAVERMEGELHAVAAENVFGMLIGQEFRFKSGAVGTVREIITSGIARGSAGVRMLASLSSPVLRVELSDKRSVLVKRNPEQGSLAPAHAESASQRKPIFDFSKE